MPVIQQEKGVKTVKGLPARWGRKAYAELAALAPAVGQEPSADYIDLCAVLDRLTAGPVPVDATYERICAMAATWARDCGGVVTAESALTVNPGAEVRANPCAVDGWQAGSIEVWRLPTGRLEPRARMENICRVRGVEAPDAKLSDGEAMRRMIDAAWWRKRLLTMHARAFEHAALRLGYVSNKAGSYCSNETVRRRQAQNARNAAMLKAAMLQNEAGQQFSLYDLASRGMANKSNRKGELMLRMAGCEAIAEEMGHVGLFVTMTCPSSYHAVLAKSGKFNPKYRNATPREAQTYLNGVWARVRAKNDRLGILPYGFRIAEPHHDGCPHWHMLVFLPRCHVQPFIDNLGEHARAEDAHELDTDDAKEARLKIIEIDPAKGTAAGYIAKYIGKNIDDSQGAAFDEEGVAALLGDADAENLPAKACERVDAWASTWGIRQFQGLGMPPVTVWRELRRVREAADMAPAYLRDALRACQRIESKFIDAETGKPGVIHAANFADYIRAQGGVNMGRLYRIAIAYEPGVLTVGKYGTLADTALVNAELPTGVYARQLPHLPVSKSTRYSWKSAGRAQRAGVALGVEFAGPWSPLNNCTASSGPFFIGPCSPVWWQGEAPEPLEFTDDDWFSSDEFHQVLVDPVKAGEEWHAAELAATDQRAKTVWTVPSYAHRRGNHA